MTPEEQAVHNAMCQFGIEPTPQRVAMFIAQMNSAQAFMMENGSTVRFATPPGGTFPAKSQRNATAELHAALAADIDKLGVNARRPTMPVDSRKARRQATRVPVVNAGATLTDEQREWNAQVHGKSKQARREREDADNADLL